MGGWVGERVGGWVHRGWRLSSTALRAAARCVGGCGLLQGAPSAASCAAPQQADRFYKHKWTHKCMAAHTPDALPPWVVCFHDSAARQPRRCLGDQVVAFLCRAQARGGAEQFRGPASIDKCAVDAGAAASTACLPAEPGCGLAAPPWVVPTLMLQEAWGAAGLATCAPLHTTEQPCHTTVLRSGTRTTREQPLVQKDAGLPRQYLQQWQQAN